MVGFKNRYMIVEVFLDPNRDLAAQDPIIITQFNVSKAIKDSILVNFGECGLASSLGSFQGNYHIAAYYYFAFSPVYAFQYNYHSTCGLCVVKYVNPITKLCIIRASREEYQKVWSAITMVRSIGNCPVLCNLLDLSGKSNNSKMDTLLALYTCVCVSIF